MGPISAFPGFHVPDGDIAFALAAFDQVVVTERYAAMTIRSTSLASASRPVRSRFYRVAGDAKQADVSTPGASKRRTNELLHRWLRAVDGLLET